MLNLPVQSKGAHCRHLIPAQSAQKMATPFNKQDSRNPRDNTDDQFADADSDNPTGSAQNRSSPSNHKAEKMKRAFEQVYGAPSPHERAARGCLYFDSKTTTTDASEEEHRVPSVSHTSSGRERKCKEESWESSKGLQSHAGAQKSEKDNSVSSVRSTARDNVHKGQEENGLSGMKSTGADVPKPKDENWMSGMRPIARGRARKGTEENREFSKGLLAHADAQNSETRNAVSSVRSTAHDDVSKPKENRWSDVRCTARHDVPKPGEENDCSGVRCTARGRARKSTEENREFGNKFRAPDDAHSLERSGKTYDQNNAKHKRTSSSPPEGKTWWSGTSSTARGVSQAERAGDACGLNNHTSNITNRDDDAQKSEKENDVSRPKEENWIPGMRYRSLDIAPKSPKEKGESRIKSRAHGSTRRCTEENKEYGMELRDDNAQKYGERIGGFGLGSTAREDVQNSQKDNSVAGMESGARDDVPKPEEENWLSGVRSTARDDVPKPREENWCPGVRCTARGRARKSTEENREFGNKFRAPDDAHSLERSGKTYGQNNARHKRTSSSPPEGKAWLSGTRSPARDVSQAERSGEACGQNNHTSNITSSSPPNGNAWLAAKMSTTCGVPKSDPEAIEAISDEACYDTKQMDNPQYLDDQSSPSVWNETDQSSPCVRNETDQSSPCVWNETDGASEILDRNDASQHASRQHASGGEGEGNAEAKAAFNPSTNCLMCHYIADRKQSIVKCKDCGFEIKGCVAQKCPDHPKQLYLMDIKSCKCGSMNLEQTDNRT